MSNNGLTIGDIGIGIPTRATTDFGAGTGAENPDSTQMKNPDSSNASNPT